MSENQIVLFKDGELEVHVEVTPDKETVWLNRSQLDTLFNRDIKTIGKHINNALKEELDNSVVAKFATTAPDGKTYMVDYYNLDMIISVGYRVKSQRGVQFRKWATSILKEYMLNGIAINKRRLEVLNKVIDIQNGMIANQLHIEKEVVTSVINEYVNALALLDDYDHQVIKKIENKTEEQYRLTYDEVRKIIDSMSFGDTSIIFGKEKEKGVLSGIIDSVYQSAFGEEAYKTIQEKAANLLYFIVKDHPFVDGCKRIAATIFLYFLNQNGLLFKNRNKIISESTLVAVTLLLAESRLEEKETMINVILHFLNW